MFKSERVWIFLRYLITFILVVLLVVLAITNLQEDKMLPAIGCFLIAALFILRPKMVVSILLALLALAVIIVFAFEQTMEELVKVFQAVMKKSAGRIAIYSFGYCIFAISAIAYFYRTKVSAAIGWGLPAVFCAVMIFREGRRRQKGKQRRSSQKGRWSYGRDEND